MSSKRRLRRRSCTQKRRFPNEGTARTRARAIFAAYGRRMVAYCCDFCGGWHHRSSYLGADVSRVIRMKAAAQ